MIDDAKTAGMNAARDWVQRISGSAKFIEWVQQQEPKDTLEEEVEEVEPGSVVMARADRMWHLPKED
jgi:hypothetical protein